MGFTEHKITAFTHRISDLPDQPSLSPGELKARFDSSPEELRQALGAVCDEGDALATRIDSYRAQTFEGEIEREMLAPDVQEELSGKAEQADVSAMQTTVAALETALPQKCEVIFGTYTGDGAATRTISLGFTPKVLMTCTSKGISGAIEGYEYSYGGVCTAEYPVGGPEKAVAIVENGFTVKQNDSARYRANINNQVYYYLAFV